MTTHELIAALRRGAPVTPRLVREIIIHLERLDWAERSLKAALEKYGAETVPFTRDECGYVCDALEESERLKEAAAWMVDTMDACTVAQTKIRLASIIESALSFQDARKAVEELL